MNPLKIWCRVVADFLKEVSDGEEDFFDDTGDDGVFAGEDSGLAE